jgi:hypothetical protein
MVVHAQARFFRRPGRQSHAKQQNYKACRNGGAEAPTVNANQEQSPGGPILCALMKILT